MYHKFCFFRRYASKYSLKDGSKSTQKKFVNVKS